MRLPIQILALYRYRVALAILFGLLSLKGIAGVGTYVDSRQYFSEGLGRICVKGRYGFIDTTGRVMIEPTFLKAADFREGTARVLGDNGKVGFVNKRGKYVIEPVYQVATDFGNGVASVSLDGDNFYYVNIFNEKVHGPEYHRTYLKYQNARYELVRNGKTIKTVKGIDRTNGCVFHNGLLPVQFDNGMWGYIDTDGKTRIEPIYDSARDFSGGLAFASRNVEGKGFCSVTIDIKGEELTVSTEWFGRSEFRKGYAVVKSRKTKKYGFVDLKGRMIIDPIYDEAAHFSNGLAYVRIGQSGSYINNKGESVFEFPSCDDTKTVIEIRKGLKEKASSGKK